MEELHGAEMQGRAEMHGSRGNDGFFENCCQELRSSLLRCRDELLVGLHKNSGVGSAAGSGVIQVRMAKRKKICECPHADSPYARNLLKFH